MFTATMRRRLFLPGLLLVAAFALLLVLFVRGTWAQASVPEPQSVESGPIARVVQLPDGSKDVCAAIRLGFPLDEVWQVITDYDNYGDICSFIQVAEMTRGPDNCKVTGQVKSLPIGSPLFTVEMKHEQELFEYRSLWDQASGNVQVNRGGWIARPIGNAETLLMIRLEVQVRWVPGFVLRNLSRYRLCEVLRAVQRRLIEGPQDKPW
jgi:hypothetical protein